MIFYEKKLFIWNEEKEKNFIAAKELLASATSLARQVPSYPLVVVSDVGEKGIRAALHQVNDAEEEEPLAFASKTLTPAEQNYSKWEREALAAVFAIRKWTTFYS
eukprot:GHVP01038819.1.p2 GENE.GHVP01038819.1~~GHVP01038819.1.p2  ORF type:complete len:105 (+),score=21.71 GHVP01038819.1:544-858(+)